MAGMPVFPCIPMGKSPVCTNGFKDATLDLEQINEWWTKKPDANIGFSPATCGLAVIDLDPGHDKLEGPLPPTYTIKSPRGIHHYYSGTIPSTTSKISPHVDTRSIGGYILLPPSQTIDGYYEILHDLEYAPLPEWIKKALEKPDIIKTASVNELDLDINIQRAKDFVLDQVSQGIVSIVGNGGDAICYKICCNLRDFGLSEEKTFEILWKDWNPYCLPRQWSEDKLQQKIYNAYHYAQNEAGVLAIEPPEKVFGEIVKDILLKEKQSRFYFKTEKEFENEPEPNWIIKDLLSEKSTALLYAPPSSYKSFIALDVALSTSTGSLCFGAMPVIGSVFYGALEGRSHLRKAIRAWKIVKDCNDLSNFYLGRAPLIGIEGEVQEFGDEIKKKCTNPKLIIIDTLSKSMAGLNENDAKDAGKFIQFCDSLVEWFGCSVLAIHHTGKDKDRGARGSSAFLAGFDTVLEIKAQKETKAVEVWVRKHKDAEEKDTPWTFEGRSIGGSLVFFETTPEAHRMLTYKEKDLSCTKVGAALRTMGAFGEDKGITTHVLAMQLIIRHENETEEAYQERVGIMSRALTAAGKDSLEAYGRGKGTARKWSILG